IASSPTRIGSRQGLSGLVPRSPTRGLSDPLPPCRRLYSFAARALARPNSAAPRHDACMICAPRIARWAPSPLTLEAAPKATAATSAMARARPRLGAARAFGRPRRPGRQARCGCAQSLRSLWAQSRLTEGDALIALRGRGAEDRPFQLVNDLRGELIGPRSRARAPRIDEERRDRAARPIPPRSAG